MGGWTSSVSRTTYRYIKLDNRWEKKSDMNMSRSSPGCGRVTNLTSGKEEVVVAGGTTGSRYSASSSTKIYTVEDDTWRTGTPLPTKMKEFVTLPYGDSFLLLGGHDGSSCLNSIYQVH